MSEQIFNFATVGAVYDDGVTLVFDGETAAGQKHYKVNSGVVLAAGNRVKILQDSGTYVVEYAVGAPGGSVLREIPAGGSDGQVLLKDGSQDYTLKWADFSGLPSGGTAGQILKKNSSTAYDVTWADGAENHIPTGGSDGQMLVKSGTTAYALTWAAVHDIPSGGTTGQVLAKNSSVSYDVAWTDAAENHIPTGGSDGQMLVKSGSTAYALTWADAHGIPSGGSDGQVLTKNGSTAYSVTWETPSAAQLKSGSYTVSLSSTTLQPGNSGGYNLGSSSYLWNIIYVKTVRVCYSAYSYKDLTVNSSGKLVCGTTVLA